jgi:hypothetical protein
VTLLAAPSYAVTVGRTCPPFARGRVITTLTKPFAASSFSILLNAEAAVGRALIADMRRSEIAIFGAPEPIAGARIVLNCDL